MAKKYTTEEFVIKAKEIHGDKYDYPDQYINWDIKIKIICKIHGEFYQIPNAHLNNRGCPSCGKINGIKNSSLTTTNFIDKSNVIHDSFYNYDKSEYVKAKIKVIITCPIHGDFLQIPDLHMQGKGCMLCGRIKMAKNISSNMSTKPNDFFDKANKKHKNRYKYNNDYIDSKTNILITCPIHRDFLQRPDVHLQGSGCSVCGNLNTSFYTKAIKWKQKAMLSQKFRTFKFYIFKFYNENEEFYKFGITFQGIDKRFRSVSYNQELIYLIEDKENAEKIFDMELKAKYFISTYKYIPIIKFNGHSECFDISTDISKLTSYINI